MPRSRNPFRLRKPGEKLKRDGLIYFVQGYGGAIKIGFAADLCSRLRALQTASPVPIHFLASIPGTMELERSYHAMFAPQRLLGEWFADSASLRTEIKRAAPGRAKFLRRLWRELDQPQEKAQ